MKNNPVYIVCVLLLASCQRELHFPVTPVVLLPPEKLVTAIVITNPTQADYDSLVYRYAADKIREVHYSAQNDSLTRTYYYDAAGRLSALEDDNAIYYTNNNSAHRISFEYDAAGLLLQTKTDFKNVSGVAASIITHSQSAGKSLVVYDTGYASNNLDWVNRIVYSTVSSSNYLLYDSSVFINNTNAGLVKTSVATYDYTSDSAVNSIKKSIYFNQQLAEYGVVAVFKDKPAPVYGTLRKKLYRNLSDWFEASAVWQDDNYRLFPLPGGPYKAILYKGFSVSAGANSPGFTRNYEFDNTYNGDQLFKSVVTYTLQGQGNNKYVTILRYYYTP